MKPILDTKKINNILIKKSKSKSWLARELSLSRSAMHEVFKRRSVRYAAHIAKALEIDYKSIICLD